MADFDIFAAAKEHVSVLEAARRLGLEPNREGKVRCLFHNDNTPSMHLYDDHFYCYVCKAHGDAVDLVAQYRNVEPKEAAQWLLGESALPSTPKKPKAPPDYGVFEREHVYSNGTKKVISTCAVKIKEFSINLEAPPCAMRHPPRPRGGLRGTADEKM